MHEMRVGHRLDRQLVARLEHQQLPRRECVAGNIERAVDQIKRALLVVGIDRQARAGPQRDIRKHRLVHGRHRRCLAVERADDDACEHALIAHHRKLLHLVMREARLHFLLGRRQRHPHLQAVNGAAGGAQFGAGALGMHDAAPGRHPVDFARLDRRRGAEAVAVHDLAVEQIGDGGEPDMRMRPHVEAVAGAEFRRPEMVEEDERPDHARARRRQRAPHRKAVAEIDRARHHHLRDGVAGIGVARLRILAGKETHGACSFAAVGELSVNPSVTIAARLAAFCPSFGLTPP